MEMLRTMVTDSPCWMGRGNRMTSVVLVSPSYAEWYIDKIFQRAGGVSPIRSTDHHRLNQRDFVNLTSGRRFAQLIAGVNA